MLRGSGSSWRTPYSSNSANNSFARLSSIRSARVPLVMMRGRVSSVSSNSMARSCSRAPPNAAAPPPPRQSRLRVRPVVHLEHPAVKTQLNRRPQRVFDREHDESKMLFQQRSQFGPGLFRPHFLIRHDRILERVVARPARLGGNQFDHALDDRLARGWSLPNTPASFAPTM